MLGKRSTRNMVRWARNGPTSYAIASGLGNLAGRAYKKYRSGSYTTTLRGKRPTSGVGVTTQHDQRRVYRKRRMPTYRRRRWKKFVRQVNYVNEKDMGTRTVVFNSEVAMSNTTSGQHGVLSFSLYGQKANTIVYNGDLYQVAGLENTSDPTAAAGATVSRMSHIYFQSGVLDLTIRNNTSYTADGTNYVYDSRGALEVDVYEVYCRQDFTTSGTNYESLGEALRNEGNQELTIGGAGNNVLIQKRGVTPFEVPTGLSRLGVKILKKTKYFIPNSNTITYQLRDPKRRSCLIRELRDEEGANKVKWTKWVLIVFKLVPGLTVGNTAGTFQEYLAVGCTRKYTYKVEGTPENRNRYITQSLSVANPN